MREFKDRLPVAIWLRGIFISVLLTLLVHSVNAQWKKIAQFSHLIPSIYFVDVPGSPRVGFLSVGGHAGDRTPSGFFAAGQVWKTNDGGVSWHRAELHDPASGIVNFVFKDSVNGWFAARDSLPGGDNWGGCYSTHDGGETWSRLVNSAGAATSVYYCFTSKTLMLAKWWGYSGPRYSAASMMTSTDEGGNWAHVSGLQYGNGFAFVDSLNGIATCASGGFWKTSDGGQTWSVTYPDNGERWQPVAIHGSSTFLAVDEVNPAVWSSTNFGSGWQRKLALPYAAAAALRTHISGMIAGDFRALIFQAEDGFQASYDTGRIWRSICGPFSGFDTRFYLRDNYLYAADSIGGLWLNTHALGRGVPVFYDAPMTVAANCSGSSVKFPFNYSDPCVGAATLDSVTMGSNPDYAYDFGLMPREVSDLDSFTVTYSGTAASDTSYVMLHFTFQGVSTDTTVAIIRKSVTRAPQVIASPAVIRATGCESASTWIHFGSNDSCSASWQLDSVTISRLFSIDATLPLIVSQSDSIELIYTPHSGWSAHDTSRVTLHFSQAGKTFDTTFTVLGEQVGGGPANVVLTTATEAALTSILADSRDYASIRMESEVPASLGLTTLKTTIAIESDAISKSGPCIGMIGWTVTNEVTNGSELQLEVSRQTSIDLHSGDEIVRIPIRANVAVDTEGVIVLKEYSFNADFKGCTPESITPDTVRIIVTPECGDGTLRKYMRTGQLAIESVAPNPASKTIEVRTRGAQTLSLTDVLGREVMPLVASDRTTIDVSRLSPGTYYLRVTGAGSVRTARIAIER